MHFLVPFLMAMGRSRSLTSGQEGISSVPSVGFGFLDLHKVKNKHCSKLEEGSLAAMGPNLSGMTTIGMTVSDSDSMKTVLGISGIIAGISRTTAGMVIVASDSGVEELAGKSSRIRSWSSIDDDGSLEEKDFEGNIVFQQTWHPWIQRTSLKVDGNTCNLF